MPLNRCGSVRARLSVWLSLRSAAGKAAGPLEHVDPARIVLRSARSRDHVQRRLPFRSCLRQHQRAVAKSNASRPTLPGIFAPAVLPTQPAGDHQMQDEKELTLQLEDYPLAKTVQRHDRIPPSADDNGGSIERRRNGEASRTRSIRCPTTRGASACR